MPRRRKTKVDPEVAKSTQEGSSPDFTVITLNFNHPEDSGDSYSWILTQQVIEVVNVRLRIV